MLWERIPEDELCGLAALTGGEVAQIAAPDRLFRAARDRGFVESEAVREL